MARATTNKPKAIDRVRDIESQIKDDILKMMSDVFANEDKLEIPEIPMWLRKRSFR